MLGKLIKYEFKSTSRLMWFLYGALIVVGALLGFMFNVRGEDYDAGLMVRPFLTGDNSAFQIMFASLLGIYVLMIQAIFIMTIIMIITRFNKNLLGGEGYLMHTLPVKTHDLILSKGIVAMIWGVIAILSGLLSGFLFSITSGLLRLILREIRWEDISYILSRVFTRDVILGIVLVIVGSITAILSFYFAMAIGNLSNKNKFLYAVLAYVGIQVVISIIVNVIGVATGGILEMAFSNRVLTTYLVLQIVQQAILAVVFFFGTNYILKNKLNLA